MVTAAKLNVEFSSSGVGKVTNDIAGVGSALDSANGKSGSFFSNMLSTAGGFIVANGFSAMKDSILGVGSSIITANSNMEMWTKQLEVSTGSAEGANAVIKNMQNMAKVSPFDLPQLIQSANALESLGFSSQKWMPIIGNTAAATGKSVDQVTQALMDASTGEFERLKELGIRTTVEGDKIRFSFMKNGQMMTVEADNTAEGIENALMGIWDDKYSGAMETMADTWQGRLGNLKDNVNMLLMDAGKPLFDFMKEAVSGASKYIEAFTRRMDQGQSVVHSLLWAIPETLRNMGLEGLADMIVPVIKGIETGIERVVTVSRAAARIVGNVLGKAFEFLGDHMDVVRAVAKALITVIGGMMAWGAITAIVGGLGAVLAALLSPIGLLVAAIALLYLAWDKNWFGIREVVANAWAAIEPVFNWLKDAIDYIVDGFEVGGWEEAWNRIQTVASEAWNHIKAFISDIDWGAMWAGLRSTASAAIGWVVDQISSVDWSGFLSGAWGVIQNGLSLAWDAITSLNWGDFIPAITDLGAVLLQKIVNLPWGDFITAITDFQAMVREKIHSLPWGDYITAITDFAGLVAEKIVSLPWGDFITALTDFAGLVATALGKIVWTDILVPIGDMATWLVGFLRNVDWLTVIGKISDFGLFLINWLNNITWSTIVPAIKDFGSWLSGFLNNITWSDFIPDITWGDFIPKVDWPSKGDILDAIKGWLGFGGGGDDDAASGATAGAPRTGWQTGGTGGSSGNWSLPGTIPMELPGFASFDIKGSGILEQLNAIVAASKAAWATVLADTAAGANGSKSVAGTSFQAMNQAVSTAVTTMGGNVGSQLQSLAANVLGRSSEANTAATSQFGAMQSGVSGLVSGLQSGVASHMANLQAAVTSQASSANVNASSQFSSMSAASKGHFMGMQTAAALQMALMASGATTQGNATMSNMVGALAGGMARVAWTAMGFVTAISSAGGSAADAAYSAGANVSQGFANGMLAYLGVIQGAAAAMVAAAAAAVTAKAMISSPSRLFMGFGAFIAKGLERGIQAGIPGVERVSAALISASVPSPTASAPLVGIRGVNAGTTTIDRSTHNQVTNNIALSESDLLRLTQSADLARAVARHLSDPDASAQFGGA